MFDTSERGSVSQSKADGEKLREGARPSDRMWTRQQFREIYLVISYRKRTQLSERVFLSSKRKCWSRSLIQNMFLLLCFAWKKHDLFQIILGLLMSVWLEIVIIFCVNETTVHLLSQVPAAYLLFSLVSFANLSSFTHPYFLLSTCLRRREVLSVRPVRFRRRHKTRPHQTPAPTHGWEQHTHVHN